MLSGPAMNNDDHHHRESQSVPRGGFAVWPTGKPGGGERGTIYAVYKFTGANFELTIYTTLCAVRCPLYPAQATSI